MVKMTSQIGDDGEMRLVEDSNRRRFVILRGLRRCDVDRLSLDDEEA